MAQLSDDEILVLEQATRIVQNHTHEELGVEHRMASHLRVGMQDVVNFATLPASIKGGF